MTTDGRGRKAILGVALALATVGCGTTEPIACTEELRAGITVTVTNAATGGPLAEGATLTLREGDYVESSTHAFGSSLSGAWERAGTYEVSVAHPGYHTWVRTGVSVDEDECHVIPVALDARLQPIG